MKTCDTCKWWSQIDSQAIQAQCMCQFLNEPIGSNDMRGACIGAPGSGELYKSRVGHCAIFTAMKFGCIHHKPK